eukprot:10614044-Alexandrium_andersonii.AAC.1
MCGELRAKFEIHLDHLNKLMLRDLARGGLTAMEQEAHNEYSARTSGGKGGPGLPTAAPACP